MSYQLSKDKHLTDEELEHFKRNLKSATPFNKTLILMLLHTGARASEVLNITEADLDHKQKTVMIRGLKDSNDRELPLPPKLFAETARLARENPNGKPFDISYQRLYQIWRFHCPVEKGPHSARHTVGLNLYKKHNNLNLVKLVLGHKAISNTMIYAEYAFTQNELRKLVLA